jgi:hypothetical protein
MSEVHAHVIPAKTERAQTLEYLTAFAVIAHTRDDESRHPENVNVPHEVSRGSPELPPRGKHIPKKFTDPCNETFHTEVRGFSCRA